MPRNTTENLLVCPQSGRLNIIGSQQGFAVTRLLNVAVNKNLTFVGLLQRERSHPGATKSLDKNLASFIS